MRNKREGKIPNNHKRATILVLHENRVKGAAPIELTLIMDLHVMIT